MEIIKSHSILRPDSGLKLRATKTQHQGWSTEYYFQDCLMSRANALNIILMNLKGPSGRIN